MASISLRSLCEPVPRFSHRAVSVGKKIYFHGGFISGPGQGSVVDIFDPYFESWEQQPTTGTTPSKQHEGVCTSVLGSLYSFAGFDGTNRYNTLHKLDTATLEWRELQPQNPANGPMAKSGCGMVAFNCEHLAMFGGYGIPIGPIQREATFTKNFNRNAAGKGWSNELHLFNITEGMRMYKMFDLGMHDDLATKIEAILLISLTDSDTCIHHNYTNTLWSLNFEASTAFTFYRQVVLPFYYWATATTLCLLFLHSN